MGCSNSTPPNSTPQANSQPEKPATSSAPQASRQPEKPASAAPVSTNGPQAIAPLRPGIGDGTDARIGETVTLLVSGTQATVLKRTTTDVMVETRDGKRAWVEVEGIGQETVAALDARAGEEAYLRDDGTQVMIIQKTTTDVLVRLPDGKDKWLGIEDIRQDQIIAVDARDGEGAFLRDDGTAVTLVRRTTTDALVRMPDGVEKWVGIEDLRQNIKPATEVRIGEEVRVRGKGEWATVLDMTTTDVCVQLRSDGSKKWMGMEDITNDFVVSDGIAVGDAVVLRGTDKRMKVLSLTTTDLLLQTPGGVQEWHEIEDVVVVTDNTAGGALKVGDQAKARDGSSVGVVLNRTTTDVLLKTEQGEKWFAVEDLDVVGPKDDRPKDDSPKDEDRFELVETLPTKKGSSIFACCV